MKSYGGPADEPIGVGSSPDVRLVGEWRHPVQLLQDQELTSGPTVRDEAVAAPLNLSGAPIEGPTHFSQFGPLAMSLWGDEWLATGCISTHFTAPVMEGKATRAEVVAAPGAQRAVITMQADDDGQVLTGGISVAGQEQGTVCRDRLARALRPDEMQILDQEIEIHDGPLLVGEEYLIQRTVGAGRSTESMWLRSTAIDRDGRLRVTMLLHIGFLRSGVGTAAAAPSVKGSEA